MAVFKIVVNLVGHWVICWELNFFVYFFFFVSFIRSMKWNRIYSGCVCVMNGRLDNKKQTNKQIEKSSQNKTQNFKFWKNKKKPKQKWKFELEIHDKLWNYEKWWSTDRWRCCFRCCCCCWHSFFRILQIFFVQSIHSIFIGFFFHCQTYFFSSLGV